MSMPTYDQIISGVRRLDGRTVKTCWIRGGQARAETDAVGRASTWGQGHLGAPRCPPWARQAILRCLYDEGGYRDSRRQRQLAHAARVVDAQDDGLRIAEVLI